MRSPSDQVSSRRARLGAQEGRTHVRPALPASATPALIPPEPGSPLRQPLPPFAAPRAGSRTWIRGAAPARRSACGLKGWVIAGVLALLAIPGAAADSGWRVDESFGASVNGLGVQHAIDVKWLHPLTESSSPLLSGSHLAIGGWHAITPTYTRLAGWVEVSPLSILDLRAGADAAAYFGTFGSLQSFHSYRDAFDDGTRSAGKSQARSGGGSRLFLSPTLKVRVGSLVAVSAADLEWWKSGASGPYYYEPARDTLLRAEGDHLLVVSTMALHLRGNEASGQLGYGVGHSLTYVFAAPQNRSQRIGIVVMRQFGARRFGGRAPRIGGHVSYYLDDPNRRGQLCAALGLSFRLTH
jgi:hypothetical protein